MQSQCQWLRTTAIIFKLKILLQLHCNEDNCTLTLMRFFYVDDVIKGIAFALIESEGEDLIGNWNFEFEIS